MLTVVNAPRIAAIICTRNRPDSVGAAITSVLNNEGIEFETILVDQSDGTQTAEVTRPFADRLRYVPTGTRGLSAARNLGARTANAEFLAFTDDDCEVPLTWLRSAVDLLDANPAADLCYGTVEAAPVLTSTLGAVPEFLLGPSRLVGGRHGLRLGGMGANMVMRRSAFFELGGFDPLLGAGGRLKSAEDFDLQFRAHRLNLSTLMAPSLSVVHYGFRDWAEWRSLYWRDGYGVGAFFMKHIRLRDTLALREMLGWTAREAARAGKSILIHRDFRRSYFVSGIVVGAVASWRFRIDAKSRQYVATT